MIRRRECISLCRYGNYEIAKQLLLIAAIVVVGWLIISFRFIFGEDLFLYFADANDDTYQTYLPLFQMVVRKLQNHDFSLMDFTWGAGTNILSAQGNIFNPFALLLYLVGLILGDEWIASALVWMQLLQILATAYATYFYLRQFRLCASSRIIASSAISFSAYAIGGIGQHYSFASYPFFITLFLLGIEKSIKEAQKSYIVALVTAFLCICNIYAAYMVFLTGGFYALVRCLLWYDFKSAFKKLLLLFLAVLLGCAISAVVFLPVAYFYIFGSTRIHPQINWLSWIRPHTLSQLKSIFLRFFSESMEGTINNWHGFSTAFNVPHLYMSPLLIACIPQHIANLKKASKKQKIACSIGYGVFFCSLLFPLIGVVYNSFVEYTGRYIFVFLPLAALCIAQTITYAIQKSYFSFAAAFVTVVCCGFAFLLCDKSTETEIIRNAIAAFAPMAAVLWLYLLSLSALNRSQHFQCFLNPILLLVIVAAVVVEGWSSLYLERGIVTKDEYKKIITDEITQTFHALQAQSDNTFRMEYMYNGYTNRPAFSNSMISNYWSISAYNSVLSSKYQAYHQYFGNPYDSSFDTSVAYAFGQMGRPLDKAMADLWGIRYVISTTYVDDPEWNISGPYVLQDESKYWIYENPDMQTIGITYYSWYPESLLDSMELYERQAALSKSVALDTCVHGIVQEHKELIDRAYSIPSQDLTVHPQNNTLDNGIQLVLPQNINTSGQYWLVINAHADKETNLVVAVDVGSGVADDNWLNGRFSLNSSSSGSKYILPISGNTKAVTIYQTGEASVDIESLQILVSDDVWYSTDNSITNIQNNSSRIVSQVEMDKSGVFVLPICNDGGWSVLVDGTKQPLLTANACFLAVSLEEGKHDIVFSYKTPLVEEGALISLLGIVIFIPFCRLSRRFSSANAKQKNAM